MRVVTHDHQDHRSSVISGTKTPCRGGRKQGILCRCITQSAISVLLRRFSSSEAPKLVFSPRHGPYSDSTALSSPLTSPGLNRHPYSGLGFRV